MNPHAIDWIIAAVFLVLLTMGGLACRVFVHDVAGFVVAGRHMRKYLGLSTHTAEGLGIISVAGMMEAGLTDGFSFAGVLIINIFIVPIVYGCTGFVINRYREARVVTVPEYAERRYSKGVRITTAAVLGLAGILNVAIFPIMASRFLYHFLGVPEDATILGFPMVPSIMAILLGLALLFAYCGGMVSVLLTDYIQSVLIAIMIFTVTGIVIATVGVEQLLETVRTHHGEKGFNPFQSKTFGPLFLLWMVIQQVIGFPSFAPTMQRIASTDGARTARQFAMLSWLFSSGRGTMMLIWGVAALAVVGTAVPEGMDGETFKKVAGAIYLGELLPPVVFGIVLAALLAAFISTVDSYILTNATVIVNDVVCPTRRRKTSPKAQLWLLRITVAAIAVLLFIIGIFDTLKESIFEYVILTGTMMQGAGIILIGGLYWKRGSTAGAYAAVVACCLIPVLGLVSRRVFPEISFFELFDQLGNAHRAMGDNELVEMLKCSINILLPVKPAVAGLTALVVSISLYVFVSLIHPDSVVEEDRA